MTTSSATSTLQNQQSAILLFCLCCSGSAALIYEVLWMKELGLLFGNSAQAAAATLSAFFTGIAAGSWFWASRVKNSKSPLRLFAYLELSIALSVIGYFFIFYLYRELYPIFSLSDAAPGMRTTIKFILSLLILFPAAFLMGGTLPACSQYLVREMPQAARQISALYAANTLGGVCGVVLAGFILPPLLGYFATFCSAMLLNLLAAGSAFTLLARTNKSAVLASPKNTSSLRPKAKSPRKIGSTRLSLDTLALISGLVTIALQVVWTRLFAQVLQNSVQTFAAILAIFLLSLAAAAWLVNRMLNQQWQAQTIVLHSLTSAALLLAVSILSFHWLTQGLNYFGGQANWTLYLLKTAGLLSLVIFPPLLALGCVFPLLIKLGEHQDDSAGQLIGRLTAWNTCGAIIGAFASGFILLERLGVWGSLILLATTVLGAALWMFYLSAKNQPQKLALPAIIFSLIALPILASSKLQNIYLPANSKDQLLALWHGSAASVSVVGSKSPKPHLSLMVNNHYILGGTEMLALDAFQGELPLLLKPDAKTVYTIGLGTGVTAGATLQFPIQQLVASEIIPEVVEAAHEYFSAYTMGLFSDARASIVIEDGRNYLAGSKQQYDVIIGDLFVPWSAGAGNLFAVEHFRMVADRLNTNGGFMQWLPSYQLGKQEFSIIVQSFLEIFPCVTLWRGDFVANSSMLGLFGEKSCTPFQAKLSQQWIRKSELNGDRIPLFAHYAGNLSASKALFKDYPLNTDNHPRIEYLAPKLQRQRIAGQHTIFAGEQLNQLVSSIRQNTPYSQDKRLSQLTSKDKLAISVGYYLHAFAFAIADNNSALANQHIQRFQTLIERLKSKPKPSRQTAMPLT